MTITKILFVEDEPDYQLIATRILEEEGYHVTVADSAEEALEIWTQLQPDLILLDINLPGMDGYGFCKAIRQEELGANLPVLMLTVRRRPDEWLKGFSSGADDYLAKPFNPADLLDRVKNCLNPTSTKRLLPDQPENLLVESAIAGNRPAFEVLINKYRDPLLLTLMKQGAKRAEAEEIAHQTFTEAYTNLRSYLGHSTFFTWLYSIAFHLLRHSWRRPNDVALHLVPEEDPAFGEAIANTDDKYDDLERLRKALEEVPSAYRKPLEMRYLENASYDRIASRLRIPVGTVMSRLSRGKEYLKKVWDGIEKSEVV